MFRTLDRIGARGLTAARPRGRRAARPRRHVPGGRRGGPTRLFPLDLVPRIVTAEDWATLQAGLIQRVRALDAFLHDVYGEREIVRDGVVPEWVVDGSPGCEPVGALFPADAVRAAVSGIDLVRDGDGGWLRAGGQPAGAVRDRVRDAAAVDWCAACCPSSNRRPAWCRSRRCPSCCARRCAPRRRRAWTSTPHPPATSTDSTDSTAPSRTGPGGLLSAASGRRVVRAPDAGRADGRPAGHAAPSCSSTSAGCPADGRHRSTCSTGGWTRTPGARDRRGRLPARAGVCEAVAAGRGQPGQRAGQRRRRRQGGVRVRARD